MIIWLILIFLPAVLYALFPKVVEYFKGMIKEVNAAAIELTRDFNEFMVDFWKAIW